jgi:hypothetical protein
VNVESTSVIISKSFPACELTSDPAYVIYSACGSFWIPMVIMVAFYWRIYRKATMATAAIRRGFIASCDSNSRVVGGKTTGQTLSKQSPYRRPGGLVAASKSDNSIVGGLRVHRGGGRSSGGNHAATRSLSPSLYSLTSRHSNASLTDIDEQSHRR